MALIHELEKDRYTIAEAVQVKTAENTYNLLSASSVVKLMVGSTLTTFANHNHLTLGDLGQINETMDPKAPSWNFVLKVTHPALIAELCNPSTQGQSVKYWLAVIDPATGQALYSKLMWSGLINTQIAKLSGDDMVVEIETVSKLDYLMKPNEAERLTASWQTLHFNQKGLEFNVSASKNPFWGADAHTSGGGYSGGVGGGVGGGGGGMNDQYQSYLF